MLLLLFLKLQKAILKTSMSVCNFQSMKSPVELNCLFSKFFCYITWLDAILDDLQTRPLRQILLFLRNKSLAVKKLQTDVFNRFDFGHALVNWELSSVTLELESYLEDCYSFFKTLKGQLSRNKKYLVIWSCCFLTDLPVAPPSHMIHVLWQFRF